MPAHAQLVPRPAVFTQTRRFVLVHMVGLLPALAAGIVAFGWRALLSMALVVAGGLVGYLAWKTVGRRGRLLDPLHVAWSSLILAAMLPAHLAVAGTTDLLASTHVALWPILPAAGLALAASIWLLGGTTGGRVFPPLLMALVVAGIMGEALTPHLVLSRERAVVGDLLNAERRPLEELSPVPWIARPADYDLDATWRTPARQVLSAYTAGLTRPERRQITMQSVLRDRLPPLEDLIVLGHPAPIGMASAAALLAGGLFLFYRGVADVKIALIALAGAYITFGLAPVPASIGTDGPAWTWGAALGGGLFGYGEPVGWDVGLTFVHYEMLAGPLLFICLFLAPLPSMRPLVSRWRIVFALLLGPAAALAQRYFDTALGPLIALLAISLLTPVMDRMTRARSLL